jgi:hypothetical protein
LHLPSKEELMITSIAEVKIVKLTEISIMDRYSNGSFVVKDRIISTARVAKMIRHNDEINSDTKIVTNEEKDEQVVVKNNKEYKSLKNIDEKMLSIDEYLDDIEK